LPRADKELRDSCQIETRWGQYARSAIRVKAETGLERRHSADPIRRLTQPEPVDGQVVRFGRVAEWRKKHHALDANRGLLCIGCRRSFHVATQSGRRVTRALLTASCRELTQKMMIKAIRTAEATHAMPIQLEMGSHICSRSREQNLDFKCFFGPFVPHSTTWFHARQGKVPGRRIAGPRCGQSAIYPRIAAPSSTQADSFNASCRETSGTKTADAAMDRKAVLAFEEEIGAESCERAKEQAAQRRRQKALGRVAIALALPAESRTRTRPPFEQRSKISKSRRGRKKRDREKSGRRWRPRRGGLADRTRGVPRVQALPPAAPKARNQTFSGSGISFRSVR